MNRDAVFQLKRGLTIDDIDFGQPGALTPPYAELANAKIESALCIEWWRGYYAGMDVANKTAGVEDQIECRWRS